MQAEAPPQKVSPHSPAASVRAATLAQAPLTAAPAAAAHTWQVPSHGESQQTPSTHEPEAHGLGPVQLAPRGFFGAQLEPWQ